MTSSNGNIFRVIGPLWGKFTNQFVDSPHKGQWRGALMFSLTYDWTNNWANNQDAGDLRRHRTHYYVTVMWFTSVSSMVATVSIVELRDSIWFLTWWNKSMGLFTILALYCEGNPSVTCGFPHKGSVTRGFDVFIVDSMNKLLNKESNWRRFATP